MYTNVLFIKKYNILLLLILHKYTCLTFELELNHSFNETIIIFTIIELTV